MSAHDRFLKAISGEPGMLNVSLRALTAMLEPGFAAIVRRRNLAFDSGRRAARLLPRPVVCVGNLTTGGTGKTPAVAWLVRQLQAAGRSPGIITRGYRGGDEPAMLARQLDVPIHADADRHLAGTRLLEQSPATDVLVMDDGYQHRQLHRDANLLLIDATQPFGFGHLLPRGLLREPLCAARRATAAIITRSDQVGPGELSRIHATIAAEVPALGVWRARHHIAEFTSPSGQQHALPPKPVIAFCGLGNPKAWFDQLRHMGVPIRETRTFVDHHAFSEGEVRQLVNLAGSLDAVLLTTEKDRVRLPADWLSGIGVWTARLSFEVEDGPSLMQLLLGHLHAV